LRRRANQPYAQADALRAKTCSQAARVYLKEIYAAGAEPVNAETWVAEREG